MSIVEEEITEIETPAIEAAVTPEEPGHDDEEVLNNNGDKAAAELEPEDERKKTPRGVQKRLDEITKEKYEWKREAEYLREENKRLAEQRQETAIPAPSAPAAGIDKPSPDNFEDYNDYVDALTDWKTERKFQEIQERDSKKNQEQLHLSEQSRIQQEFQKSVETSKDKHSDFEDTILGATKVPCTQDMLAAIMEAPDGAEVMYYLAKNPAESARIAGLSKASQMREIGKIESRLTPLQKIEPRRITNTTEPVRTLSGAGVTERDPDKMGMEEYAQWRMSRK